MMIHVHNEYREIIPVFNNLKVGDIIIQNGCDVGCVCCQSIYDIIYEIKKDIIYVIELNTKNKF